jgi:hypothetical protein
MKLLDRFIKNDYFKSSDMILQISEEKQLTEASGYIRRTLQDYRWTLQGFFAR